MKEKIGLFLLLRVLPTILGVIGVIGAIGVLALVALISYGLATDCPDTAVYVYCGRS